MVPFYSFQLIEFKEPKTPLDKVHAQGDCAQPSSTVCCLGRRLPFCTRTRGCCLFVCGHSLICVYACNTPFLLMFIDGILCVCASLCVYLCARVCTFANASLLRRSSKSSPPATLQSKLPQQHSNNAPAQPSPLANSQKVCTFAPQS